MSILSEHGLKIITGKNETLEKQLVLASKQRHIVSTTPKDSQQRFRNESSINLWHGKQRIVHWLVDSDENLAGIIWYGASPLPDYAPADVHADYTFAIRLYENFVGKGLARPFMTESLDLLAKNSTDTIHGIWLETNTDNAPAVSAYQKFGYGIIAEHNGRYLMTLNTSTT